MTTNFNIIISIITFCISTWLAFYLLARDFSKRYIRLAGFGLITYSLALSFELLIPLAKTETKNLLTTANNIFIYLPAIIWSGGLISLLSDENPNKNSWLNLWKFILLPIGTVLIITNAFDPSPELILVSLISGLPLFFTLILLFNDLRTSNSKAPLGLALIGTIFFGLSLGLFLPLEWLPRWMVILGMGLDFVILGWGIAIFDAFEEGQTLKADMLRSLQSTFFMVLLFGGQVFLVISLSTGLTLPMMALLLASLTTAIIGQTLISPYQNVLDKLNPSIGQERSQLRAIADSISKLDPNPDFSAMPESEFIRLTRRAISHLGDLPRLASNPLTQFPSVTHRLVSKNLKPNTLSRTAELKSLLIESIQRLKPQNSGLFGSTDEWRYYNALHFPYVIGLKPSRRRQPVSDLEPHLAQALEWFQVEVPERTLHNWQNTAAQLVAKDLLERLDQ